MVCPLIRSPPFEGGDARLATVPRDNGANALDYSRRSSPTAWQQPASAQCLRERVAHQFGAGHVEIQEIIYAKVIVPMSLSKN
jgi:hypothetical protein